LLKNPRPLHEGWLGREKEKKKKKQKLISYKRIQEGPEKKRVVSNQHNTNEKWRRRRESQKKAGFVKLFVSFWK
jgi:hypothetical protein